MKIRQLLFSLLVILCFIGGPKVFAQGQIFTKTEANSLFGPVISKVAVPKAHFKDALTKCPNRVLFAITKGNAVIATPKKQTLFSTSTMLTAESLQSQNITYRVVSSTTLNDFLNAAAEDTVYVEQRANVYTLTSGDVTLEKTSGCPPDCNTL
jgi:hypothetical protein